MAEVDSLLIKQCLLKIIKCYWSLTLQVSCKQESVTVNRGPPRIFFPGEGERGVSELFFLFFANTQYFVAISLLTGVVQSNHK